MTVSDWDLHVEDWSHPPVDDVGYFPSYQMVNWSDDDLRNTYEQMRHTRFNLNGWRNYNNRWIEKLGIATIADSTIVDYGTGTGLEAIAFAKNGNRVFAADISEHNLALVDKVASLFGVGAGISTALIEQDGRTSIGDHVVDVFHCNGVMHHSRTPELILAEAHRVLHPDGHAQFMLYTDVCWHTYIGGRPPQYVEDHVEYPRWVRTMDAVGSYADWYDASKLAALAEPWFELVSFDYITDNNRYAVARLEPK